eukprot:TRINITY_DN959_c0_g1_i1.p1 TRINITY_DN959_c0_g1~~TRINITY_DN959_c0_g1_i1.p1  ORF type:complete len:172 (-),score=48.83 TRINITY_DN959_c0_g1_i1:334-849(-)
MSLFALTSSLLTSLPSYSAVVAAASALPHPTLHLSPPPSLATPLTPTPSHGLISLTRPQHRDIHTSLYRRMSSLDDEEVGEEEEEEEVPVEEVVLTTSMEIRELLEVVARDLQVEAHVITHWENEIFIFGKPFTNISLLQSLRDSDITWKNIDLPPHVKQAIEKRLDGVSQ